MNTSRKAIAPSVNTRVSLVAMLTAVFLNLKVVGGMLLKGGWLFKTGLTMMLSLATYGFVYGWRFAIALIGLLIIHEFGHWVWLKANGVAAEVPIFIPFVGAVISLKKLPEDEAMTAWTALAGPLIGGAGALICWGAGFYCNYGPLMAGGCFGFMLNLFQLVPAMPLDGGWVLASISRKLLIPGTILLILLAILSRSPLLIIICIVAIASLFARKKVTPAPVQPVQTLAEYEQQLVGAPIESGAQRNIANDSAKKTAACPKIKPRTDFERCAILVAYLLLTGLLAFMSVESFAVTNARLHVKSPFNYLKGKEKATANLPDERQQSTVR
jgi:Zn-dependent protease